MRERDKQRFLELAKLYESSWNGLRAFEWKIAFALWATSLAATAVAVTKTDELNGLPVNGRTIFPLFSPLAFCLLFAMLASLWVAYVLAQVGIQSAFAYFGSNRDYYIRRVAGIPLRPREREHPPVFGAFPRQTHPNWSWTWVLPWNTWQRAKRWRLANNLEFLPTGWLSIFTHALITAALFSLSYVLIWNAASIAPPKARQGATISLSVTSP